MNTDARPAPAAPQVENLKTLLSYQQQAIVSRMLVKNSGGSVTLFAFDGGEGLSEHTAPFDALVLGVEGSAQITVAGQHYQLAEGESLLMPANIPHAVHPQGQFKMLLVMIKELKS